MNLRTLLSLVLIVLVSMESAFAVKNHQAPKDRWKDTRLIMWPPEAVAPETVAGTIPTLDTADVTQLFRRWVLAPTDDEQDFYQIRDTIGQFESKRRVQWTYLLRWKSPSLADYAEHWQSKKGASRFDAKTASVVLYELDRTEFLRAYANPTKTEFFVPLSLAGDIQSALFYPFQVEWVSKPLEHKCPSVTFLILGGAPHIPGACMLKDVPKDIGLYEPERLGFKGSSEIGSTLYGLSQTDQDKYPVLFSTLAAGSVVKTAIPEFDSRLIIVRKIRSRGIGKSPTYVVSFIDIRKIGLPGMDEADANWGLESVEFKFKTKVDLSGAPTPRIAFVNDSEVVTLYITSGWTNPRYLKYLEERQQSSSGVVFAPPSEKCFILAVNPVGISNNKCPESRTAVAECRYTGGDPRIGVGHNELVSLQCNLEELEKVRAIQKNLHAKTPPTRKGFYFTYLDTVMPSLAELKDACVERSLYPSESCTSISFMGRETLEKKRASDSPSLTRSSSSVSTGPRSKLPPVPDDSGIASGRVVARSATLPPHSSAAVVGHVSAVPPPSSDEFYTDIDAVKTDTDSKKTDIDSTEPEGEDDGLPVDFQWARKENKNKNKGRVGIKPKPQPRAKPDLTEKQRKRLTGKKASDRRKPASLPGSTTLPPPPLNKEPEAYSEPVATSKVAAATTTLLSPPPPPPPLPPPSLSSTAVPPGKPSASSTSTLPSTKDDEISMPPPEEDFYSTKKVYEGQPPSSFARLSYDDAMDLQKRGVIPKPGAVVSNDTSESLDKYLGTPAESHFVAGADTKTPAVPVVTDDLDDGDGLYGSSNTYNSATADFWNVKQTFNLVHENSLHWYADTKYQNFVDVQSGPFNWPGRGLIHPLFVRKSPVAGTPAPKGYCFSQKIMRRRTYYQGKWVRVSFDAYSSKPVELEFAFMDMQEYLKERVKHPDDATVGRGSYEIKEAKSFKRVDQLVYVPSRLSNEVYFYPFADLDGKHLQGPDDILMFGGFDIKPLTEGLPMELLHLDAGQQRWENNDGLSTGFEWIDFPGHREPERSCCLVVVVDSSDALDGNGNSSCYQPLHVGEACRGKVLYFSYQVRATDDDVSGELTFEITSSAPGCDSISQSFGGLNITNGEWTEIKGELEIPDEFIGSQASLYLCNGLGDGDFGLWVKAEGQGLYFKDIDIYIEDPGCIIEETVGDTSAGEAVEDTLAEETEPVRPVPPVENRKVLLTALDLLCDGGYVKENIPSSESAPDVLSAFQIRKENDEDFNYCFCQLAGPESTDLLGKTIWFSYTATVKPDDVETSDDDVVYHSLYSTAYSHDKAGDGAFCEITNAGKPQKIFDLVPGEPQEVVGTFVIGSALYGQTIYFYLAESLDKLNLKVGGVIEIRDFVVFLDTTDTSRDLPTPPPPPLPSPPPPLVTEPVSVDTPFTTTSTSVVVESERAAAIQSSDTIRVADMVASATNPVPPTSSSGAGTGSAVIDQGYPPTQSDSGMGHMISLIPEDVTPSNWTLYSDAGAPVGHENIYFDEDDDSSRNMVIEIRRESDRTPNSYIHNITGGVQAVKGRKTILSFWAKASREGCFNTALRSREDSCILGDLKPVSVGTGWSHITVEHKAHEGQVLTGSTLMVYLAASLDQLLKEKGDWLKLASVKLRTESLVTTDSRSDWSVYSNLGAEIEDGAIFLEDDFSPGKAPGKKVIRIEHNEKGHPDACTYLIRGGMEAAAGRQLILSCWVRSNAEGRIYSGLLRGSNNISVKEYVVSKSWRRIVICHDCCNQEPPLPGEDLKIYLASGAGGMLEPDGNYIDLADIDVRCSSLLSVSDSSDWLLDDTSGDLLTSGILHSFAEENIPGKKTVKFVHTESCVPSGFAYCIEGALSNIISRNVIYTGWAKASSPMKIYTSLRSMGEGAEVDVGSYVVGSEWTPFQVRYGACDSEKLLKFKGKDLTLFLAAGMDSQLKAKGDWLKLTGYQLHYEKEPLSVPDVLPAAEPVSELAEEVSEAVPQIDDTGALLGGVEESDWTLQGVDGLAISSGYSVVNTPNLHGMKDVVIEKGLSENLPSALIGNLSEGVVKVAGKNSRFSCWVNSDVVCPHLHTALRSPVDLAAFSVKSYSSASGWVPIVITHEAPSASLTGRDAQFYMCGNLQYLLRESSSGKIEFRAVDLRSEADLETYSAHSLVNTGRDQSRWQVNSSTGAQMPSGVEFFGDASTEPSGTPGIKIRNGGEGIPSNCICLIPNGIPEISGRSVHFTCWARASKPCSLISSLRSQIDDFNISIKDYTVGTDWTPVRLTHSACDRTLVGEELRFYLCASLESYLQSEGDWVEFRDIMLIPE
ncbi:hypothetical protein ACWJJH_12910 [Endozoicomonadaceae bacterium StTr2]